MKINWELVKEKIKPFKKKRFLIPGILALILITFFILKDKDPLKNIETERASRGDLQEVISETGVVEPADQVDLVIERPGKLIQVNVKEGDRVSVGQLLAQVDTRTASVELTAATARLQGEEARLQELLRGGSETDQALAEAGKITGEISVENAEKNLQQVRELQNQAVETAYANLISSDLRAYLVKGGREDADYSFIPPVITGSYTGTQTGIYTIRLYASSAASGYSFEYSGVESGRGTVSTTQPQPLGTKGLFIQFSENFARGVDVVWEVPVPNTRSAAYVQNKLAYEQSLKARDSAIQSAENTVRSARAGLIQTDAQNLQALSPARAERVRQQQAVVTQARTAVWQAQIALSQGTLRSPFSGIVTSVNGVRGQYVTAGVPIVSLMSDSKFKVVVNIPETDITNVQVGDESVITFDAYDDVDFKARVVSINPAADNVNGVRSFKTTLQFDQNDERVRAGLTADIEIVADGRKNVISIPSRAVFDKEGGQYVRVRTINGEIVEKKVTTGLRSSDGLVEIKKGLDVDEEVVTFLSDVQLEALKKLESKKSK